MTVNDAVTAELPFFRAEAEALMVDTCRITKPGVGKGPLNPATGKYDAPDPVVVYEGPCRISRRESGAHASPAEAGSASWAVGEYPLSIPFDTDGAADVAVSMTVEYLTAPNDVAMIGRKFGVAAVNRQTHATARRFRIKEVVG